MAQSAGTSRLQWSLNATRVNTMSKLKLSQALLESVKHYKAVADLAEELETLGRAEQTIGELDKTIQARRQLLVQLTNEHKALQDQMKLSSTEVIEQAKAEAVQIKLKADEEFMLIINDARDKASNIKSTAQEHGEAIIKQAKEYETQAIGLLEGKEAELQRINEAFDAKSKALAQIQAKYDAVKEQLKQFIQE